MTDRNDLLDEWFDILERAAMSKALEPGDEKLAAEAREAREKLREAFRRLEADYAALVCVNEDIKQGSSEYAHQTEVAMERIASLESELLNAKNTITDLRACLAKIDAYLNKRPL